jgi:UDP-2,3-diacylglucosamine pyrophosphatase LpxH
MHSVSDVLLKQKKIRETMKNTLLLQQCRDRWRTLSPILVKHASVIAIQDKVLTLGVYTATWKQELSLMTPTLIQRFSQWFPDLVIHKIQFTMLKRPKKQKNTPLVIKASTLEASIRYTHEARKASGQHLCRNCQFTYTYAELCLVCQSKKQYQELHNP